MTRPSIYQVHIADGFADDCEELIHQCLKTELLTYESFCEIWKNNKFGYLYHGRTSGTEMAELTEELLYIAKHYMVTNTSNFEESVAGLFIVYGILNLQPFAGFAPLRIVPEDVPAINRIELTARRQKRYDVLYILGSVLTEGPVQYHAEAREHGMEIGLKKYMDGYTGIDRIGVRPKGVFYRQNEELDIIRELNNITRRYTDAKKSIGGEASRNLNYTDENLASDLDASLKKLLNGVLEKNDEADKKIKDHYVKVQAIKDRAMKQSVDGVKFLQSAGTKALSPIEVSPKKTSDIKEKPGKLRLSSPKKIVKSQKNTSKRKRLPSASSSDSDDEHERLDVKIDDDADLDLNQFDKQHEVEDHIYKECEVEENIKEYEVEVNVNNIPVEKLPMFVRTLDGKPVEIEFVNNYDAGTATADKDNKTVDDAGEGTSSGIKYEDINESLLLKRTERRYLKKTIMKSKFKRMGILEIANFEENEEVGDHKKKEKGDDIDY